MGAQNEEIAPIAYSVSDAVKVSSLSRTTLWRLERDGMLKTRTIGSRKLILAESLKRVIEQGAELNEPA